MCWIEHLQALAGQDEVERAAFQSVAVAALETLERVHHSQRRVAAAALSLAQRQKLHHMLDEIDATAQVVRPLLHTHSAGMLDRAAPADTSPEPSWWFALCEVLHVLEEGTTWIESVVAGQPRSSATYTLGRIVARLLHRHHHTLLAEAEQWMG